MARVGRPRYSDPTPVPPNLEDTPAANPKHVSGLLGGWEYPLSREEKKHRVLCLYQAELEQAEKKNSDSPKGEKKDCAEQRDGQSLANGGCLFRRNVAIAALLVLMAVLMHALLSTLLGEPQKDRFSCELNMSDASSLGLPPPNISDRIYGLRSEGHARLKMSKCAEAEWWFSNALTLLLAETNLSKVFRSAGVGERGFALVCAQSFEAGAEQLEQHLNDTGFNQTLPHLTNALGYAYYNMQEVRKSAGVFEAITKIEPLNPIVWNNLASASMVEGNMTMAETALGHAIFIVENQPELWLWYHEELIRSLHNFQSRLENRSFVTPNVELWNGYLEAL
jgi:tetratricopeptide (TPR) repeat protein